MATESDRYLAKARESLASAEADLAAERYNSAANRAYYAAFQAAVAALIHSGANPLSKWEHDFVSGEFSGKLIHRRKVFGQTYKTYLRDLFDLRLIADYRISDASRTQTNRAVGKSREFVGIIEQWIRGVGVAEPGADYGGKMKTAVKRPQEYVNELKRVILAAYPDLRLVTEERDPTHFTLELHGNESVWDAHDLISDRRADIADEHGVWIVVLPLDESWRDQ